MPEVNTTRRRVIAAAALCVATAARAQPPPAADAFAALGDDGVVLFRHANAPGVGDPPAFRLADCSTQRNLDAAGRDQARRIGTLFRERGVKVGAVLHSQWCRTQETAALAFPQMALREAADFNSFFGNADRASAQSRRALATLQRWRGPGVLVVVTHQVNITALTGAGVSSAEGLVVRFSKADPDHANEVARIAPHGAGMR